MTHNAQKTCWNCPAAKLKGNVDFRGCGQSGRIVPKGESKQIMIECKRRPGLGHFEPTIEFQNCPEWRETEYGYLLEDMRVMILGIDGYLGWTLALKLGNLGCQVSGIDNFTRRELVDEKGSQSVVPIRPIDERLEAAKEVLDIDINFREMDLRDEDKLRDFIQEVEPESIVHYAEISSAPYSMGGMKNAVEVQDNNVLGTLKLLHIMKDEVPTTSLVKLGTMGEMGSPLTGRPLFEGLFPSDAKIEWEDKEWSLGGEMTPRDPASFYHCSKVHDTYNIYESCKYWWMRSMDVMQGIIYGVHTEELAQDKRLRTRLDVDEAFGTLINRFVSQAVSDIPLTVYGEGEQIRGMIPLRDAMECMVRLIGSPSEPGQYDVVNQISGVHKVKEVAETVADVAQNEFDLDTSIQRIENPRVEPEQHPFYAIARKLPKEFGFESNISMHEEVEKMFEVLTQERVKERIRENREVILPETRWDSQDGELGVIEEYEPGEKEMGRYKGKIDRGKED
ncbi:NAD-dependent dehydratase [archaeon SCG-AAA382B04]|nr:NAD-dependent dehydratase [archaeon SCG-AAA382B04]